MKNIVIATIKSWNIDNAIKLKKELSNYSIHIISNKDELTDEKLAEINPEFIFFPHWSWFIPKKIYEQFECVVFHMTDLPFGRGGSPLQNLIENKIYNTKISALKVEKELDAGKLYLKREMYIGLGSAEEIFILASKIVFFDMIPYILEKKPIPYPQLGEPTYFHRRKPEQSNILKSNLKSLDEIYDHIRMLDAEGYPKAYLEFGNFKIELSEVHSKNKKLVGRFEIFEGKDE